MRRAAKVDGNQAIIVELLRKAGASVYVVGLPVDLLVGYRGITTLVEIKDPASRYGKRGLNDNQKEFVASWLGSPVVILDSIESTQSFLRGIANA